MDVIASTHIQGHTVEGETLMPDLHRYMSKCKQRVIIIDEMSVVAISTWADIALGAFLGCIYVVVGDEGE